MKKIIIGFIIAFVPWISTYGQNLQDGQKRWSPESKLTVNDFKIKISDENNDAVFSQFMISHAIGGFDFMKGNLNQKIENIFLGNASWIDATRVDDIQKLIDFQQMQFDIAEIYARNFRKKVLESKGQIAKGFDIVDKINDDIMTEFSKMRIDMINETQGGQNVLKLSEWKVKIATELKELDEFRFENKKKIKTTK